MTRRVITVSGAPVSSSPLSPGIVTGQLIFVSGRTAPEAHGIEGQTRAVLEKIGAILRAAGSDYASVARCGVYLKDAEDFGKMNTVYREFFPTDPPARSTIICSLVNRDVLVEIDCVAAFP